MTRCIDADGLIKGLLEHERSEFEVKNHCITTENLIKLIQEAPEAEAQRPKGRWIYTEFIHHFEGGGSIRMRGYNCPFCENFINKKSGPKKYCDECGADLSGEEEETP